VCATNLRAFYSSPQAALVFSKPLAGAQKDKWLRQVIKSKVLLWLSEKYDSQSNKK